MNWKQVTGVFFSPTENTKKAVGIVAGQLGHWEELDLTEARSRTEFCFDENEVAVIGAPVYGGRIPQTASERLKKLHGKQTAAVILVTYGNRDYEDALAELQDAVEARGFVVAAAASVSAEHNIVRSIAAGRPDASDKEKLEAFGRQAAKKLQALGRAAEVKTPSIPGNRPYRAYSGLPIKIKTGSACEGCGLCIRKCPVQAISRTDPKVTDETSCIACMRCISICPKQCRQISRLLMMIVSQKMKKLCAGRKEPEFFI